MTKERREEVILVALVASVILHGVIMLAVAPCKLTSPSVAAQQEHRQPMRVTGHQAAADNVKLEELLDLKALKDAPAAGKGVAGPEAAAVENAQPPPVERPVEPSATPLAEAPVVRFEEKVMALDDAVAGKTPAVLPMETPHLAPSTPAPVAAVAKSEAVAAPSIAVPQPKMREPAAEKVEPVVAVERERPVFTPAKEVYEKVDEKVIAREKAAVRELVGVADAAELKPCVNAAMAVATEGEWTYFRVMMVPRRTLPVVSKDVVILLDASGSIGWDRIVSVREATRKILRTVTNTGDRFNLVAFRDRFTYAFRSWQDCDASAFAAGERWLNRLAAHGRTDVFSTISSVLTLPRDPARPLIALVVTDGDANVGVSDTEDILAQFTKLNDGLVSVYMYGVKSSANRELIDCLTHGNRGESLIFEGWRWKAGAGLETLSERFRDPVLSDLRVVYATSSPVESYPRLLRNLYRGDTLEVLGRVPSGTKSVAFSLKGLSGTQAYESYFELPVATASTDPGLRSRWEAERAVDARLNRRR